MSFRRGSGRTGMTTHMLETTEAEIAGRPAAIIDRLEKRLKATPTDKGSTGGSRGWPAGRDQIGNG